MPLFDRKLLPVSVLFLTAVGCFECTVTFETCGKKSGGDDMVMQGIKLKTYLKPARKREFIQM